MEKLSNGLRYLSENTLKEIKQKFPNQWQNIYYSVYSKYKSNYLSTLDDFFLDFFSELKDKKGEERNKNKYFYDRYKKCFEKKNLPNNIYNDLFKITPTIGNLRKKEIKEETKKNLKEILDTKNQKMEEEHKKTKELLINNLLEDDKIFFKKTIEKNEKIRRKWNGLQFIIKNIGEEKYFLYLKNFFDKLLKNKETGKKREIFIQQTANEIFGGINTINKDFIVFLKRFFNLYKENIKKNPPGQIKLF